MEKDKFHRAHNSFAMLSFNTPHCRVSLGGVTATLTDSP